VATSTAFKLKAMALRVTGPVCAALVVALVSTSFSASLWAQSIGGGKKQQTIPWRKSGKKPGEEEKTQQAPTLSPVPLAVPELEEEKDDRLSFSYPIADEQGGGKVTGRAGQLESPTKDTVILTDRVEAHYKALTIQADRLEIDLSANHVRGEGHIIIDQGPRRLAGRALEFDLKTQTGSIEDASAYVDPDFYFKGEKITKLDDRTYRVRKGVFTSCSTEVPAWSFKVSRATVTVDGYARAVNTRMRIKKLPILYMPYLLWPVKHDRTSGLLVPNIGYAKTRGYQLGLAYYQVLGRSYDTTFYLDLYENHYLGFGNEFRYRPTEGTSGIFQGYMVRSPEGQSEYRLAFVHDSRDLPGGLRAVVRYTDYSDFNFFQDFERQFNNFTLRSLYSSAYLSGNWGAQSFNLLLDDRKTFLSGGNTLEQRQLPEVEYQLRSTQLGRTPFFFQLKSSAHVISIDSPSGESVSYERTDWQPVLSLPLRAAPWLSLSVSAGERYTWYSDSLDPTTRDYTGNSVSRTVNTAGAEIVGPSFSRIFTKRKGTYSKFKHVIEPRITYSYVSQFDDQNLIPRFDEIDRTRHQSLAIVSLVNRVLAKPRPPATEESTESETQPETAGAQKSGESGKTTGKETKKGATETEEERSTSASSGEAAPGGVSVATEAPSNEASQAAPAGQEAASTDADVAAGVTDTPAGDSGVQGELAREADLQEGRTAGTAGREVLSDEAAAIAAAAPREIFSFEVAEAYSFDPELPQERSSDGLLTAQRGPIVAKLRFNPSAAVSVDASAQYSALFNHLIGTSLSGGVNFGEGNGSSVGLSWFTGYNAETGEKVSDQARLFLNVFLVPQRLMLKSQLNYDIKQSLLQQQSYTLTYIGDCYAVQLEYFNLDFVNRQFEEVRLSISLKNVGTFLDLHSALQSQY
jgi:hypothetical protein